jgi:hypothetical protein
MIAGRVLMNLSRVCLCDGTGCPYIGADNTNSGGNADEADSVHASKMFRAALHSSDRPEVIWIDRSSKPRAAELRILQRADSVIWSVVAALQQSETPLSWNDIVDWSAASKSIWRQWHRL